MKKVLRTFLSRYRLFMLSILNANFRVGKDFVCGRGCFVSRKNSILIGNSFYMGNYCHLAADAKIGDNVMLASFVAFVGGDHKIDFIDKPIKHAGRDVFKTITINDNVWIGHGAIIMHGVTIGSGAVIAAGSVVTKDIPSNAIYGGNPCKFIRYRYFNDETNNSIL